MLYPPTVCRTRPCFGSLGAMKQRITYTTGSFATECSFSVYTGDRSPHYSYPADGPWGHDRSTHPGKRISVWSTRSVANAPGFPAQPCPPLFSGKRDVVTSKQESVVFSVSKFVPFPRSAVSPFQRPSYASNVLGCSELRAPLVLFTYPGSFDALPYAARCAATHFGKAHAAIPSNEFSKAN